MQTNSLLGQAIVFMTMDMTEPNDKVRKILLWLNTSML